MARIMCTQKLWRALGEAGQPPVDVSEPGTLGAVLGSWATKLFHYDRRGLVLALNERTYLTLVFPLAPRAQFRAQFASALRWALHDFGVPSPAMEQESMVLDFLPMARLTNRSLTGSLNDLEFLGRCELDYTSDLRRVQRNLNEVPHVKQEPSCAIEAVGQVFGTESVGRSRHRSH